MNKINGWKKMEENKRQENSNLDLIVHDDDEIIQIVSFPIKLGTPLNISFYNFVYFI